MAEAETYWKSLWGEEAQHNVRAEWIRRGQKKKLVIWIGGLYILWKLLHICQKLTIGNLPGNDQIQNYWLKAFPATHRHTEKNFNAIIEEPEKTPDWLTTGITYLIPKSGDSKEVSNYQPLHA